MGGSGQGQGTSRLQQKNIGAGRVENRIAIFNEIAVAAIFSDGADNSRVYFNFRNGLFLIASRWRVFFNPLF
jgi:hypothetical protein